MGAAAFSVVAAGFRNDGRVIAGIATGVGFIGAGMIFHDSARGVVGFATAASSWAAVAVGVLSGVDRELLAVGLAALCIVVLELEYAPFIEWFWRHRSTYDIERYGEDARYGPIVDEPSDTDGTDTTDPPASPGRPTT